MKRFKSIFTLAFAMLFISAISFTSCGGKKEANDEANTEHPADSTEHPADSTEHPADSTDHPADSTAQ